MSEVSAGPSRGDICVVALADLFRGDGEIMASGMGYLPALATKLARLTHSPGLVLTDGVATVVDAAGKAEWGMPYERVFNVLWWGKRHVIMGAAQIDQHGNQNISCVGPHERPKVQLLGARGAPGNTVCHTTSYWVDSHSSKVFVPEVDFVSGVGPRNGAFEIRAVVSNLGVFDFQGPGHAMRCRSLHPGVSADDVSRNTCFDVHFACTQTAVSRAPTEEEAAILERLDPGGRIRGWVKA